MGTRLILCVALLSPALVHAASYTSSFEFTTTDQSIWGNTGPLPITNANPGPQFYGIDESIFSFGDASPTPSSSLYFGGYASGIVGVEVDFQFDSGTFDAIVPYSAGLSFSYAQFNAAGGPATIQTEAFLQGHAFLQTRSPDLQFGADLVFGMTAGIYGGGCVDAWLVSGCANFNESFTIDDGTGTGDPYRLELVAVNRGGDGEFRLLPKVQELIQLRADSADTQRRLEKGDTAANEKNSDGTTKNTRQRTEARLKHLVNVGAGLPALATADVVLPELGTSGGAVGGVLQTARAEDNFLNIELDIDGILTSLGTLPPLEIEASLDAGVIAQGSLSANLADITLKPSLTLAQQFSLTPVLEMDLKLSRAMQVTVDGVTTTTDVITGLAAGSESFLLQWDDGTPLFVTPTYRLSSAAFVNDLDLGLDLSLNLKLLSASAQLEILGFDLPKFSFGPLVEEEFNLEGILAPGEEGFGLLDLKQWTFELDALKALNFVGDVITMFPAEATFVGGGGDNEWGTAGNWEDGVVADAGNMVVINDNQSAAVRSTDGGADGIVEVGDFAVGAGASVTITGGHLMQGVGAAVLANEGNIFVVNGGTMDVTSPISGGGRIAVSFGGTLNGPLDLNGQRIELGSFDSANTVNAVMTFDVDPDSMVTAFGNAMVNVTGVNQIRNEGVLAATGSTAILNVFAPQNSLAVTLNNEGGLIEATGGGKVVLSTQDLRFGGTIEFGLFKIKGGVLSTDTNPNSAIESPGSLWLDNVTNNATVRPNNQLWLENTVTNNGSLSAKTVRARGENSGGVTELLGSGVLNLLPGGLGLRGSTTTLINGPAHTISGEGNIGHPTVFDLVVENRGTISATAGGLTIQAVASSGATRTFINDGGTLEAGSGSLVLGEGDYDFAGGLVHARGGNVTLSAAATTVGGNVTGPGGIWKVSANRTINFQNGATQWLSLKNGVIRDGEIVLEGGGSDIVVDGKSLRNGSKSARLPLTRIGSTGTLRLINTTLDLSSYLLFPGSTSTAAQLEIASGGNLFLEGGTLKTRADIDLLGSSGAGTLTIRNNASVVGYGKIDSDGIQNGGGTVRAEGGTLELDAALIGSGNYEAAIGSHLVVDLGTCTLIFGIECPFTRVLSAEGELAGNNFLIESGESVNADSSFTLIGAGANPFIKTLTTSRIELKGQQSSVSMLSTSQGQKRLTQTLETLDKSARLILSGGAQFFSTTSSLTLTNNSFLEVADTGTSYIGPALNVQTNSNVNMRGGVLDVNTLSVQDGTTVNGFGTITDSVINNAGKILADNGELEIANSTVNQLGASGSRLLEATAVVPTATEPDPASILRLSNTQVNGGTVRVGERALLAGNGTFNAAIVVNFGTVLAGEVSIGNASTLFLDSALFNFPNSNVIVSNATLGLYGASVLTYVAGVGDPARTEVFSATTDSAFSILDIQGGTIGGGELALITEGVDSTPPATISILSGFGTLTNVDLTVDEHSLVDANFDGLRLIIDVGVGSIDNAGTMQASSGGILQLRNGVMTGAGDVIAHGGSIVEIHDMDFQGANLTTRGDGIIRDIAQSTFTNLTNDGVFEVSSTGDVTLAGNTTNVNDASSKIHVTSGGIIQLAGGGTTPGGDPVPFSLSGGTFQLDAGATVIGNGQVFNARGVVITGNGRFEADVFLDGNSDTATQGSLQPGASPGMMDFTGDVTFGALNDLEIELGGLVRTTEYDWFNVGGDLFLDGTLNVVLFDLGSGLFNPGLGDTFDIFDAASIAGVFAGITLPGLDAGLVWNTSLLNIDGVLSVAAVPLPPAVWMFLAALAGLFSAGKRRNREE